MITITPTLLTGQITRFVIQGLHGSRNVDIPVKDNRVIVVGVNGLGKTTIANMFYSFLSRQWRRLLEYDFALIGIETNGRLLILRREQIEAGIVGRRNLHRALRRLPPSIARKLESHPNIVETITSEQISRAVLREIAYTLDIPLHYIELMAQDARRASHIQESLFPEGKPLDEFENQLLKTFNGQVLYLPTYRRIEKDLKTIFPELEEHIRRYNERRKLQSEPRNEYIELVEFGMEDVEETVIHTLTTIKEKARAELNTLAGNYLRDVIRGTANAYERLIIDRLDENSITRILNRVEEKTLSEDDKQQLRLVIKRIKSTTHPEHSNTSDNYIAHFFSRLVEINDALTSKEAPVSDFATVCNLYLQGKRLVYDEKDYSLQIMPESGTQLEFRMLSSGEKQIVSLFSHIYLGEARPLAVMIDEPELSLSVEWQKRLLPDILNSKRCFFLFAATHSPFVFDNQLDSYAVDLRDCLSDYK